MTFTHRFLPFIVGSPNQTQADRLLQKTLSPTKPSCKSNTKIFKNIIWGCRDGLAVKESLLLLQKIKVQFLALT